MTHHAKAPSTGSSIREAGRLGRILRGVFATHGASGEAQGSSAPSAARLAFGSLCLAALVLTALLGGSASPAGADEACPNEAIRAEQHSPFLPDCRAYELVSPPGNLKNGADVLAMSRRTRAAASGDAVEFSSLATFGDALGSFVASEYLGRRDGAPGTNGWATHAITPPQEESLSFPDSTLNSLQPRYVGEFSSDLSKGVFLAKNPLTATGPDVATIPNIYLRDDLLAPGAGSYTLLSDCPACTEPIPDESPIFQPGLAGASADFGHLFFESVHNLTAETINAHAGAGLDPFLPKLYEWDHGTVRLAGVLPDGSPAPSSAAGLGAGAIGNANLYAQPDVVSRDGSRVVFTSPVEGESYCEGACDLYLRDTHDTASTADDETIQLNTDNGTTYEPALFQGATSGVDASGKRIPIKVFFTSGPSLYVYDGGIADAAPDNITKISDGPSAIIGESEDGAYVYFISDQQLDPGSPIGCDGTTPCIFVWHQGTLRSVAKINGSEVEFDSRSARLILSPKAAALTPDGTHLLFRSEGSDGLTGYDQGDSCPGDRTGSNNPACAEIYVYDATANGGTGELLCASCNPSGAPATADADIDASFNKSVAAGGTHLPHAISDDGRYVFFSTAEGLVPRDTNGVSDAYEFDTTTREVHLISSGTASADSYFLDAGANGHDVFFVTRGRLLAWDHDESQDLYDARIGGGFPEPPPVPAPCAGDDCQGSQTSSPEALSPASANAIGFGNPHRRRHHHKKHRHRRQRPNHHRRRSR